MRRAFAMAVVAAVIASGLPATAHHSNPLYFDMSKAITLEGEVLRVEWINYMSSSFSSRRTTRANRRPGFSMALRCATHCVRWAR